VLRVAFVLRSTEVHPALFLICPQLRNTRTNAWSGDSEFYGSVARSLQPSMLVIYPLFLFSKMRCRSKFQFFNVLRCFKKVSAVCSFTRLQLYTFTASQFCCLTALQFLTAFTVLQPYSFGAL